MNRMMVGRDVDDCVWGLCFFFFVCFCSLEGRILGMYVKMLILIIQWGNLWMVWWFSRIFFFGGI